MAKRIYGGPYYVIMHSTIGDSICSIPALNALRLVSEDVYIVCSGVAQSLFCSISPDFSTINAEDLNINHIERNHATLIKLDNDLQIIRRDCVQNKLFDTGNLISWSTDYEDTISVSRCGSAKLNLIRSGLAKIAKDKRFYLPAWAADAALINQVVNRDLNYWVRSNEQPAIFPKNQNESAPLFLIKEYVVIAPCGSYSTKKWPISCWIELVSYLRCQDINICLITGPCDTEEMSAISPYVSCNLVSAPIQDVIAAIKGSALVITHDCGPMHLAASMNIPTIAIFGPTCPNTWFCYPATPNVVVDSAGNFARKLSKVLPGDVWSIWPKTADVIKAYYDILPKTKLTKGEGHDVVL